MEKKKTTRWLLGLVVLFLSGVLVQRTFRHGDDFVVFYQSAVGFFSGRSPYDTAHFGNMVFKYPPWILPIFFPFVLFSLPVAKIFWGLIEAASLGLIVHRMHTAFRVPAWILAGTLLLFSGLIIVHGIVGQITLSVLAILLLSDVKKRPGPAIYFLSIKLLTEFPLLFFVGKKKLWQTALKSFWVFSLFSLPLLYFTYHMQVQSLFIDWSRAMFSGTHAINQVRIGFKTREAQGLPSLFLRMFSVDETIPENVLMCVLISAILGAGFWWFFSRGLPEEKKWLGWIALTPLVQPLAWFHFFLFALPFFALSLADAVRAKSGLRTAWILSSGLMIGAISEKTLGGFGLSLEMASIKSLGVLLCLFVSSDYFARSRRRPGMITATALSQK